MRHDAAVTSAPRPQAPDPQQPSPEGANGPWSAPEGLDRQRGTPGYGQLPTGSQPSAAGWRPGPGDGPPPPGTDGFAIASLVLGIVPVMAGLLGIVFGAIALPRIRRSGQRGRGMAIAGLVLGSLWLVAVIAAFAIAVGRDASRSPAGALTSAGTVSQDALRVGDCVSTLPEGESVLTVDVVPCASRHAGEVYSTSQLGAGPYPGPGQVERLSLGRCRKDLPAFVGGIPGQTGFGIRYLQPTSRSWPFGGRGVTCILHDPSGVPLDGEARGTGKLRR